MREGVAGERIAVEAGFAGDLVFGAEEEGLGRVDAAVAGIGAEPDDAELEFFFAAEAFGDVLGGGGVGGERPNVEAVVG